MKPFIGAEHRLNVAPRLQDACVPTNQLHKLVDLACLKADFCKDGAKEFEKGKDKEKDHDRTFHGGGGAIRGPAPSAQCPQAPDDPRLGVGELLA